MINLVYQSSVGPELKANLEARNIRDFFILLPSWVHEVIIAYNSSDDDALISIYASHPYRWIKLTFTGAWFDPDSGDKTEALIHELMHAYNVTMSKAYLNTMDELKSKEGALIRKSWMTLYEGTTQDLTHLVMRLWKNQSDNS